jgi:type IV secretory pathway VirB10-like protein
MKTSTLAVRSLVVTSGVALLLFAASGCSKQETVIAPEAAATNAPAQAQATPTAVPPAPANPEAFQPDLPPPDQEMVQVDRRVQQRDYEGAVDILLRAQMAQRQLTAAQRADQYNRMRQVQKEIADAMASGDPNAQRAARLLMQYNRFSTQGRSR